MSGIDLAVPIDRGKSLRKLSSTKNIFLVDFDFGVRTSLDDKIVKRKKALYLVLAQCIAFYLTPKYPAIYISGYPRKLEGQRGGLGGKHPVHYREFEEGMKLTQILLGN